MKEYHIDKQSLKYLKIFHLKIKELNLIYNRFRAMREYFFIY